MKEYVLILKLLLKNLFRSSKKDNKTRVMWIVFFVLMALVYAMLVAALIFAVISFAELFRDDVYILLTYIFIIAFFIVLVFGLFSMLSYLYFSRDTEFFLTLPVKSSRIYMAKLTIVYMIELVMALLIMIPLFIIIGATLSMGALYYITVFIAMFIVPAFSLMLGSIISIPLMYLVSFLKKRAALSSIISILLFGGIFAAYMFFVMNLTNNGIEGDPEANPFIGLVEALKNAFPTVGNIFYPFKSISRFASGEAFGGMSQMASMLVDLLIFLGSAAVMFTLAVLISNSVYRGSAARNLESGKTVSKEGKDVSSGQLKSLVKTEWKELYRNATYAFQCLPYIILCPVLLIVMNIVPGMYGEGAAAWLSAVSFIALMGISTNVCASTAFSRMGQTFYYCKTIPVDYKTQVKAKVILSFLVSSATIVVSIITMCVLNFNILYALLGLVFCLIANYAFVCFAVRFDLKNPKLEWATPTEAVKQNKNLMVTMFTGMGISLVMLIVSMVIMVYTASIGSAMWIVETVFWAALIVMAIVFAVITHLRLYKDPGKLFEKLP